MLFFPPKTLIQFEKYFGLIDYLRQYITNYAIISIAVPQNIFQPKHLKRWKETQKINQQDPFYYTKTKKVGCFLSFVKIKEKIVAHFVNPFRPKTCL